MVGGFIDYEGYTRSRNRRANPTISSNRSIPFTTMRRCRTVAAAVVGIEMGASRFMGGWFTGMCLTRWYQYPHIFVWLTAAEYNENPARRRVSLEPNQ